MRQRIRGGFFTIEIIGINSSFELGEKKKKKKKSVPGLLRPEKNGGSEDELPSGW